MASLKDLWSKHYGKLFSFLAGWLAEAQVDLSSWLEAAKALVGL